MLPARSPDDALFLDFDGTLVEIAPSPTEVIVPEQLKDLLRLVAAEQEGAVAIVSGRPIKELDQMLAPCRFAAAGEHGAELRGTEGGIIRRLHELPTDMRKQVQALGNEYPGVLIELKTTSAAVHFRAVPEVETSVIKALQAVATTLDGYELLRGKMVAELKLQAVDKGRAVAELAGLPVFARRRPVYIGDDVTDEAAFKVVNDMDGISVRVGDSGNSAAQFELANVQAMHQWLAGATQ